MKCLLPVDWAATASEPPGPCSPSAQMIESIRGEEASQDNNRSVTQGRARVMGFTLKCERTGVRGREGARGKREFPFSTWTRRFTRREEKKRAGQERRSSMLLLLTLF